MDEHQQQTHLTCEARPGNRTPGQGGERHLPCSSLLFCTGRLGNVQRLKLHVQSYYPAAHLTFVPLQPVAWVIVVISNFEKKIERLMAGHRD